ncbi:hypothetical protein B296_00021578 [Ensete ventricosum]|uniref:Uncharacterized protein n=1 Tax=Ensete ventricosum TaxID=4639 RepID=A0A427AXD3_ENSVE|nr:hypothetical protein B296_00021578 [Ensete ventricosum]
MVRYPVPNGEGGVASSIAGRLGVASSRARNVALPRLAWEDELSPLHGETGRRLVPVLGDFGFDGIAR